MIVAELMWAGAAALQREAALFAGTGFLLLGASDLAVDALWLGSRIRGPASLPPATGGDGPLALFVPAWDEAEVIGPMLRSTLAACGDVPVRVYVGCYANDPATAAAARGLEDPRLRLVVGEVEGPTTKADCLNRLWTALLADEARGQKRAKAIVLHDAEDVVHPGELPLFERLIGGVDFIQLPVLPLIDPDSPFISGHYADEFAEAHAKELVVREAVGAALPSAGVGCAFSRRVIEAIAAGQKGAPFDGQALTEDYELGLKVSEAGGRSAFLRLRHADGSLIATREYFPGTLRAAVAQKSRWTAGIALAGWDRLGWRGGLAERWMRLRDRQGVLAAFLLFAGYLALGLWFLLEGRRAVTGQAPPSLPSGLAALVRVNLALLAWRLAVRSAFVTQAHGWREGARSIPRAAVGNAVTMLAAAAALARYRALRRTGRARWGKTAHMFPVQAAAAG